MDRGTQSGTVREVLKNIRAHTLYYMGVRVDNLDASMALDAIETFIAAPEAIPPHEVYFTNVHTIHCARNDSLFRERINAAAMVLPDGSGLKIAGRMFGHPVRENLNGTDFIPRLLGRAEAAGWSIYLLGGRPAVNRICRAQVCTRYPGLEIAGSRAGYFSPGEQSGIIDDIARKAPDILLVGMGSPLQEAWIGAHGRELGAKVCIGVGGLFDFIAGAVTRAPRWIRSAGCEWMFRFLQDPAGKWSRVLVEIPLFLGLVALRRLAPQSGPPAVSRECIC